MKMFRTASLGLILLVLIKNKTVFEDVYVLKISENCEELNL